MKTHKSATINLKTPIFIIGPTCVGKSTLTKQLAKYCNIKQIDLDSAIEEFTGVDIETIFHYEGEKGFRAYETTCLKKASKQKKIIATGAGCILAKENRQIMQESGSVIYLSASTEVLLKNYLNSKRKLRPLLEGKDSKLQLETMNKLRTPLYQSIANLEIMVDLHTSSRIFEQVIDFVKG